MIGLTFDMKRSAATIMLEMLSVMLLPYDTSGCMTRRLSSSAPIRICNSRFWSFVSSYCAANRTPVKFGIFEKSLKRLGSSRTTDSTCSKDSQSAASVCLLGQIPNLVMFVIDNPRKGSNPSFSSALDALILRRRDVMLIAVALGKPAVVLYVGVNIGACRS